MSSRWGSAASEGLPHGADAVMPEADGTVKSYVFMLHSVMESLTAGASPSADFSS